ncbi:BNR-4 repeat-containing protein [Candidatus Solirubrobacter pratensis]|uniref:BNR-4 repeat-containing protein n=1 Tax=Candidatus Solirubrobacter pratensis TaxID=1298857 RepID=UPI0004016469|nr:BNR-4 repeat-containing protein [Candidatus Solirubrobacter pratensis]
MELGSGAWCWFAEPRAIVAGDVLHVGWVDGAGDIRVATVSDAGSVVTTATLHAGLGVDDHNNPALLLRADGRVQAFYSAHGGPQMYSRLSSDGIEWDVEQRVGVNTPGSRGYTYPNPVQLAGEDGRIHLFWRGGDWNPAFSTSVDGLSWAPAATLVRVPGQRPYVKIASDGGETIHVAFTDGHPRETATSLYYARYTGGAWYRAGGRRIPGPPFSPADADLIWDVTRRRDHAWVHDVAFDGSGRPRVVYAVFRSATDHRYRHACWTGSAWADRQLTPAGGFFDDDGAEQQYSGGIVFDHADPAVVYLSRRVGEQWEIERWHTGDAGATWQRTAITSGSGEKNVRPVVARGGGPLWMRGGYVNYRRYRTAIVSG